MYISFNSYLNSKNAQLLCKIFTIYLITSQFKSITDHVSLIFKLSDKNGDGGIDFNKLCASLAMLAATKAHPEETQKKLFEKLDVNHDGTIDENEVFNFLNFLSPGKVTKEALIAKIDTNGDGKLSLEECIKASHSH